MMLKIILNNHPHFRKSNTIVTSKPVNLFEHSIKLKMGCSDREVKFKIIENEPPKKSHVQSNNKN